MNCKTTHIAKPQNTSPQSYLIIKPLAIVSLTMNGIKPKPNNEASEVVSNILMSCIEKEIPAQFTKTKYIPSPDHSKIIINEMLSIVDQAEKNANLSTITIHPYIYKIIDSLKCDAAIGCIEIGYTQAINAASGVQGNLMPAGDHLEIPNQSSSKLAYFIIDRSKKQVVFYQKNTDDMLNPLYNLDLQKQSHKILSKYFK